MAMSENIDEHNEDSLDVLLTSIDKAKSTRDARDAAKLAKLRHEHDTAIDTIMQAVPSVTRVIEISDRLDTIRTPNTNPYRIWYVGYGKAGIIRSRQKNDTRICGIGILLSSSSVIALLSEQEYEQVLIQDVTRVHVPAGVYDIALRENRFGVLETDIRPLKFANIEWDDMSLWYSYENETDQLRELAKALPTFEDSYWNYARSIIADVVDEA